MFRNLLLFYLMVNAISALYDFHETVVVLTTSTFDELVVKSDDVWIVEYFAPWCGNCQSLVPEYTEASIVLQGIVKVGAIDADKYRDIANRYQIQGFPTIKIFAKNKRKPVDFTGERTARSIVDAAVNALRKVLHSRLEIRRPKHKRDVDYVTELTDESFDRMVLNSSDIWMVKFYAPWCQHCKNLAPHWTDAATKLKGKMKLGAIDVTTQKNKASEYVINTLPTIKFFPRFSKNANHAEDYTGGRITDLIVDWAFEKITTTVEIVQLVDEEIIESICGQGVTLCVFAILPNILDCNAVCRNNILKILKDIAKKYIKHSWGFVWAEALSQPHVENVLDLGGFGYPAMAVVNLKKMHYTLFKGAFDEEGLQQFFRNLSYGRGSAVIPVRGGKIPKILQTEKWDGKDGEMPIENEIEQSDDKNIKEEL